MDDAADGLLALSSTAAALADNNEEVQDDDRSSSLSELDEAPDIPDLDEESITVAAQLEADSEAETERLEESPDKLKKKPFGISPSKLVQSMTIDQRPEIEALTDSGVSSPISPLEDSDLEQSENEAMIAKPKLLDHSIGNKRKRLSDVLETEDQGRIIRRRTGSIDSDEEKEAADSDNEEIRSREATIEPLTDGIEQPGSDRGDEVEEDEQVQAQLQDQPGSSDEGKAKKPTLPSRSSRRRKGAIEPELAEVDEENEREESDEEVDGDDADVQAKSEEEQAKRAAAMEALVALEQRFATLRDRLYDERISQINHELTQLSDPEILHPELLRQVECVQKHRDQKFEIEQKLLVYKVAALKRKSIAERSQIHSAYFQTVRDIRERHLERISEQFYRIQRDRFKSNAQLPAYTIPFAEKRSTQITQQIAYNKEVSILAGIAKYRGFPAAPELPSTHQKELDEDIEKMAITLNPVRTKLTSRLTSSFDNSISAKAAGEQFLEQTPWANPQHPMNRIGINRQVSEKSPFNESFSTPTQQQKSGNNIQPAGSASTILDNPSQPASSALNTPHDPINNVNRPEVHTNGASQSYRLQSTSPTETRRALASVFGENSRPASQPRDMPSNQPSSPLTGKMQTLGSPKRTLSAQPENVSRNLTSSPFRQINEGMPTTTNIPDQVGVR